MLAQEADATLIKNYLRGDQASLSVLYSRHLPAVFHFIARLGPSDIDPEDVVQDAFVKAWKHLKKFDREKSFKTWIFTIAKRTLLDAIKKKRPLAFSDLDHPDESGESAEIDVADDRPLVSEILEQQDAQARVDALLGELPPASRAVIILHAIEGLTFREIGEILEQPLDTVKTRYRRALARLAELLDRSVRPGQEKPLNNA